MAGELENVQDQQVSGNLGRAVVGRAQRLLQQGVEGGLVPSASQDRLHANLVASTFEGGAEILLGEEGAPRRALADRLGQAR